jgi:hypothetical protein
MRQVSRQEQDALLAILARRAPELRAYPGVYYVDAGYRIRNGVHTEELTLRSHVARKLPADAFDPRDVIPKALDGTGIDVVESSQRLHSLDRRARHEPLSGGVECGNPKYPTRAGTLGLIVQDGQTGEPLALSNHHVLVRSAGAAGDPIDQPQSGKPADSIGTLWKWDEKLDCAVAKLNPSRTPNLRDALELPPLNHIAIPLIGMPVTKSGVTTKVTRGLVDGVGLPGEGFTIVPDPDHPELQNEISLPGDSGAVWIDVSTNDAIGLHWAGEDPGDPERAWAHRMTEIATTLGFTL